MDEELTEEVEMEPTVANECKRYALRDKRPPRKFLDKEYVLLTEGVWLLILCARCQGLERKVGL